MKLRKLSRISVVAAVVVSMITQTMTVSATNSFFESGEQELDGHNLEITADYESKATLPLSLDASSDEFYFNANLSPGDTAKSSIVIQNVADMPISVSITEIENMLSDDPKASLLLDALDLTIDLDGEAFYQGKHSGLAAPFMPYVEISPGEEVNLNITMSFPRESDNRYQGAKYKMRWVFEAVSDGDTGNNLDTPTISAYTTDGEVTISWNEVEGSDGYEVYAIKDGKTYKFDVTDTTFNHTGLTNGDDWSYYVKSYKIVDGERVYSDPSNTVDVNVGIHLDIPQNFDAVSGDEEVTLTWDPVKGATGYIIYAYRDGEYHEIEVQGTSYTHSGLVNGDHWTYYVAAYKDVNDTRVFSDPTESITITVGKQLNAPQNFEATTSHGEVVLTWTDVRGAEGYIVYAYKDGKFYQFDVTDSTFTHTGLVDGENWTYYVVAYKTEDGERVYSVPSKSVTVTVGDPNGQSDSGMGSPQDFTAHTSDGEITLTWSKVDGADGYIVYAYKDGKMIQFEVTDTSFIHSNLTNGDIWTYTVAPYKDVDGVRTYGDLSKTLTVTVGDESTLIYNYGPDTPKGFTATTTDGEVTLTWEAVDGADGYVIYAYKDGKVYKFEVTGTSFKHTGLDNGDHWTYSLVAYTLFDGVRIYSDPTQSITVVVGDPNGITNNAFAKTGVEKEEKASPVKYIVIVVACVLVAALVAVPIVLKRKKDKK